jgi:hypothetical protein
MATAATGPVDQSRTKPALLRRDVRGVTRRCRGVDGQRPEGRRVLALDVRAALAT